MSFRFHPFFWPEGVDRSGEPATVNGVLACLDGGHPTDAFMEEVAESQKEGDEHLPHVGDLATTYGRWAGRIANEYKLEFGIPKRTEANRALVRMVLYKRLQKRNTRYAHMRALIPLALELVFLKDQQDLVLDDIMLSSGIVERAQKSVQPYWKRRTWAGWIAQTLLPTRLSSALSVAYPGTFSVVPGFVE